MYSKVDKTSFSPGAKATICLTKSGVKTVVSILYNDSQISATGIFR